MVGMIIVLLLNCQSKLHILILRNDIAFVRNGYQLQKIIDKNKEELPCLVEYWSMSADLSCHFEILVFD